MIYRKRSAITMTPGELIEFDEGRRIFAEAKRRDREWQRLLEQNAAQGIYRHPVDTDDPWSEIEFSRCPPGCTKHGDAS